MAPAPHLRDLIDTVRQDTGNNDALAQLATAAGAAAELTELSDQVLGYFVENARAAGCSWLQISETLGVTKQAVHKRFAVGPGWTPSMERFTERTKVCVQAAAPAASGMGHNYIGTEHILLGLYAAPGGIASSILEGAGIPRTVVEEEITERVGRGIEPVPEKLPYTPKAMRVFERTLKTALEWGHNYIGTEHFLVALYGDDGGVAQQILEARGLRLEGVKAQVVERLAGFTA